MSPESFDVVDRVSDLYESTLEEEHCIGSHAKINAAIQELSRRNTYSSLKLALCRYCTYLGHLASHRPRAIAIYVKGTQSELRLKFELFCYDVH